MKKWIVEKNDIINQKIFSQSNQDGILYYIFSNLNYINQKPFCMEFGFNNCNLRSKNNANVANLIFTRNFDYILFDGENSDLSINLHKEFLTSENICDIFKKYNIPKEPEYISIDVDSTDLWLLESILKEYKPMVISSEYNCHFPLNSSITMINEPYKWNGDRAYGASLKALNIVAKKYDYTLCFVAAYQDAFYIRNDLIKNCIKPNFESFSKYCGVRGHAFLKNKNTINKFIDYEEFLKTNDINKSKEKIKNIIFQYMFSDLI